MGDRSQSRPPRPRSRPGRTSSTSHSWNRSPTRSNSPPVKLDARLAGDLGRWWSRVGSFVRLPKHYVLGGTATARGSVRFATGHDCRRSAHAQARECSVPRCGARSRRTADGRRRRPDHRPQGRDGDVRELHHQLGSTLGHERPTRHSGAGEGRARRRGRRPGGRRLNRLGKTLKLFADPRGPDSMHGRGTGPIRFRYSGDVTTFGGTLDIVELLGRLAGRRRTGPSRRCDWKRTAPTPNRPTRSRSRPRRSNDPGLASRRREHASRSSTPPPT